MPTYAPWGARSCPQKRELGQWRPADVGFKPTPHPAEGWSEWAISATRRHSVAFDAHGFLACHQLVSLPKGNKHARAAHARLARVTIENLPYQEFIARYDRPATLFYLDPPYWGCEGIYGRDLFGRADFAALAELLGGLKGSFMMSLNDRAEVRRAFRNFTIEPIETTYTASRSGGNRKAKELLITGPKRRSRRP